MDCDSSWVRGLVLSMVAIGGVCVSPDVREVAAKTEPFELHFVGGVWVASSGSSPVL